MSIGVPPVRPAAMSTPGSLVSLMDGLEAVQRTIGSAPALEGFPWTISTYRWEPDQADYPALWNWMLPSSSEIRDLSRIRDTIVIQTRIAIQHSEVESKMAFIEAAADAYRALIDPTFWNGSAPPAGFREFATWGQRSSMQSFGATGPGGVSCVGIEFITAFLLDRRPI